MKTRILVASLIAAGFSFNAAAADSANLAVSATVNGICKFTGGAPAPLVLSNVTLPATGIDPSIATSATGSTSITYKCTKGVTGITYGNGQGLYYAGSSNNVKHATLADTMAYSLSLSGPGGTGLGFAAGDQTLTINGTILQAAFAAASAGTYSDTVAITINP